MKKEAAPRQGVEPRRVTGMNIARLRRARGLTQEQLAAQIGHKNAGYLSQIESGQRAAGPVVLGRLALVLEVDVAELRSVHDPADLPEAGGTGGAVGQPSLTGHPHPRYLARILYLIPTGGTREELLASDEGDLEKAVQMAFAWRDHQWHGPDGKLLGRKPCFRGTLAGAMWWTFAQGGHHRKATEFIHLVMEGHRQTAHDPARALWLQVVTGPPGGYDPGRPYRLDFQRYAFVTAWNHWCRGALGSEWPRRAGDMTWICDLPPPRIERPRDGEGTTKGNQ